MSKSRLEKFLYALYSLDSSDLPTPLSRIEELYKCWVTGEEVSTFKPLSRVENYLMAILGVYDADELPNPISRVEVLLYKLATGDDNLDDVKSFLSEHEELLAEIIRNRGAGGNIDIEYVLYTLSTGFNTLYNTAEKPVKSAILKGNTLVNFVDEDKKRHIIANGKDVRDLMTFGGSKKYTFYFKVEQINTNKLLRIQYFKGTTFISAENKNIVVGINTFTITTPTNTTGIRLQNSNGGIELIIDDLMILEGNYTNVDITYFVGMQSVKMPVLKTIGKNLFGICEFEKGTMGGFPSTNVTITNNSISLGESGASFTVKLKGKPNTKYTISFTVNNTSTMTLREWNDRTQTTNVNGEVIWCYGSYNSNTNNGLYKLENVQIEESSVTTSYEPYKSNILSTSEDVELPGIGDVRDELDLLTGELVSNFDEVILTGDEKVNNWATSGSFFVKSNRTNQLQNNDNVLCVSDKIPSASVTDIYRVTVGIGSIDGSFVVRLPQLTTSDEVSNWLKQNAPIKVLYATKQATIKTVDLSVVDQDGNDTKLSTFNDIAHVTLSSEGLIPEVELEVATKNEEVLNTMSLEMDDISTTQNALQETSNTQSENIDSTMLATTEIYEGLL